MESKGETLSQLTFFGTDAANNIVPFSKVEEAPLSDVQLFAASMVMQLMTPEEWAQAVEFLSGEE